MTTALIHATCLAAAGRGVLIRGPSGSGKSDLALRCIANAPSALIPASAMLVADDQVFVETAFDGLIAIAPGAIRGLLEIRGVGIVKVPHADRVDLHLIADLVAASDTIDRLPDPALEASILGVSLPLIRINPFDASAHIKLLSALLLDTAQH